MLRNQIAAFAAAILLCGVAHAQSSAPDVIETPATHLAILDYASGAVLDCRECDVPMPPASMSKLMTMLIVSDKLKSGAIKFDTQFPVSENAWRHGAQSDGSHMFLEINSQVSVRDLIRGVVIVSANDACIVLAEGIAGSEEAFVDLMNRKAHDLGLASARFRNSTGLPDPDHVISAADLARLAAVIIRDHPDLYKIYAERSLTFNGKTQENRNPLLGKVAGADGVKTGHTSKSGYGMIGSAERNGQRRIIVFNGLPTMAARSSEAQRLMNSAFFDFNVATVAPKGKVIGQANVWMGSKKTVGLISPAQIQIAAHRSVATGLKAAIVYDGPLAAPIKQGDKVAALVIEGPGYARQSYPLVAAEKVQRSNVFARAAAGLGVLFGGGS
ncbi:MAG: D-alanyl-D-alanine carboxypeptidase family protein [Caulobacterales bacterium]